MQFELNEDIIRRLYGLIEGRTKDPRFQTKEILKDRLRFLDKRDKILIEGVYIRTYIPTLNNGYGYLKF